MQFNSPDGLVVVSNGGKEWVALVETKVARSDLTTDQVEGYLDIAREQGFDSVITISNQRWHFLHIIRSMSTKPKPDP